MKTAEDVRKSAAEQGIAAEEALKKGWVRAARATGCAMLCYVTPKEHLRLVAHRLTP